MRVAYVTAGKAEDLHEWSGLNAAIRASLVRQGIDVENVQDVRRAEYPLLDRVRRKMSVSLMGASDAPERSVDVVSRWSKRAADRIDVMPRVDAIVSTGTLPVAFLQGAAPLVIWTDATFHALRRTYPEYAGYSRAWVDEGDRIEQAALGRASVICFASEWAAEDAVSYYGVSRNKIRVIPFGANCDSPFLTGENAADSVAKRDWSVVRFVFVGVDWQRKGGDLAVAIVQRLNERGTKCLLSVVGCRPPAAAEGLPFVECLGFLSKKRATDSERLKTLLLESHFLLVPSSAECFGLVFAEASAFALPSIARAVGGVPSAVRDGRSGVLLTPDAGADAFCDALEQLLRDRGSYAVMCMEAWRDSTERLNWTVAGSRFAAALNVAICEGQSTVSTGKRP